MQNNDVRPDEFQPQGAAEPSYGTILKEIGISAKDLIQSEVRLLKAEVSESARKVGRHATQAAVFGGLLALSVFPFLAFLVIGLGDLLDGRYWLSSLIVAIVCAGVGGVMAFRAYKKLKEDDLTLPRTRDHLSDSVDRVQNKVEDVKHAATGDRYVTDRLH